MAEPKRKVTYDDVLAAPEHRVAEIVDGELFLSPRPASPHGMVSSVLGSVLLGAFQRAVGDPGGPGGWWILDEPELHLGADVAVPDISGWRREPMPRVPNVPWFELRPDWVCETLSPATARLDRGRKLAIYAREGVGHVWLLDPLARTLEILRRGDGAQYGIVAVHTGDDRARAEPFEAIELELTRLRLD